MFLSYARKDMARARNVIKALQEAGISVYQDVKQIPGGTNWRKEIVSAIKHCRVVLILLSRNAVASDQVPNELAIARKTGKQILPVALDPVALHGEFFYELARLNVLPLHGAGCRKKFDQVLFSLAELGVHPEAGDSFQRTERMTEASGQVLRAPGRARRPAANPGVEAHASNACAGWEPSSGMEHKTCSTQRVVARIAPARLQGGADRLIGRDEQLSALDKAWNNPPTNILMIVAWGGVGKTSMVVEWMARKAEAGWQGFDSVFDWSFYSQGTREQGAASADSFIRAALEFFGGEEGQDLAASKVLSEDKGAKLAEFIRRQRTLLVLDGLEPLQYPPGPQAGQLRDPGLASLLRGLARQNPGLCLITTREHVADLASFRSTTALSLELRQLTVPDGVALLRTLKVRGADDECRQLVKEVMGHALTLNLVGRYLAVAHGGDIRKRDQVKFERADAEVQGGHAFRVMATYERWFASEGERGLRSLALLRLLALFDRPAEASCLAALRRKPAIPGLTAPLLGLTEADWNMAVQRLTACGLVSVREPEDELVRPGEREASIDAHPLIREYFAKQLQAGALNKAWRAAHKRLYKFFLRSLPQRPERSEEMAPVYRAVAHGCQAGLHNQVLNKVYSPLIQRGQRGFAQKDLGAGADVLSALSWFFDPPWKKVVPSIRPSWRAWLPGNAASALRALTRIQDAVEPMQQSLAAALRERNRRGSSRQPIKQKHRRLRMTVLAAIRGRQLGELLLIAGNVSEAIKYAELGVGMAELSGHRSERMTEYAVLGDALHAADLLKEAEESFRTAERLQMKADPAHPFLYSLWGFRYCQLLLRLRQFDEVRTRASCALKWADDKLSDGLGLLDVPLALFGLAQCDMARADAGMSVDLDKASARLNEAVQGLRKSGKYDFLPMAYLIFAGIRRRQAILHSQDALAARRFLQLAQTELDEATEIATRSGMVSFQIDAAVERCRLALHQNKMEPARESLADARKLIRLTEGHYSPFETSDPRIRRPEFLAGLVPGTIVGNYRQVSEITQLARSLGENARGHS